MLKTLARRYRDFLNAPLLQGIGGRAPHEPRGAVDQKILALQYRQLRHAGGVPLRIPDAGFRCYSQFEEDGIILFIFSMIGTSKKSCVEICAGDGMECNTANLIVNHRWTGLLVDGNPENVAKAEEFYSSNPDTKYWKPAIVHGWITKDNVNEVITSNGFSGEVDLLSLDIDGIDYWLWKEIACISPRVVVMEFNHLWGPDASVTVPYADDFVAEFTPYGSDYAGASLRAMVKLSRDKGYHLVGTNAIATNAFFLRDDLACDWLPEIDPASCFEHPRARFGMEHRFPAIKDKKWIEV
jgi:hypothetical protein